MKTNDELVRRFLNVFERMDADELIEYFATDALYHNVPLPALHGREAIYESLKGLPKRYKGLRIETLNQVSEGRLVMNERIDYFQLENREVALPIAGIFEIRGGKIQSWREYFDLGMFKGN